MQKQTKSAVRRKTAPPIQKKLPLGALVLLALAAAVAAGVWLNRARTSATAGETASAQTSLPQTTAAGAPTNPSAFEKLVGRWQRPDGGYILDIRGVDGAGKMAAAYLNPNPIHVARAQALRDGPITKVFVELRDINYPGSTYSLVYEPSNDRLNGVYFQAVERQEFEVAFERMK